MIIMLMIPISCSGATAEYTIKGDTLTINKTIKSNTTFKNPGSIKTIVIKEGIKKLPAAPFEKCTKVKQMKVPGNLVYEREDGEYGLVKTSFPQTLDQVQFTSGLKDIGQINYYDTKKYVTYKKDEKFKSIAGSIYSKDGKTLLGVPTRMEKLTDADR